MDRDGGIAWTTGSSVGRRSVVVEEVVVAKNRAEFDTTEGLVGLFRGLARL